jgi:hypothetical protein
MTTKGSKLFFARAGRPSRHGRTLAGNRRAELVLVAVWLAIVSSIGAQTHSGYNKHVHFAVWDPADNNPWTGPGVAKTRFGGEGTGWTTCYPFEWKTNVTYRFCSQIIRESATNTLYLAFFHDPEADLWKHLATIRRTVGMVGLDYQGSFLEDFTEHNWIPRSFLVGNQWARVAGGQWLDLRQGCFNCSVGWENPYTNNYDGDVAGRSFRLEAGGLTVSDTFIGDVLQRDAGVFPPDLSVRRPMLTVGLSPAGWFKLEFAGVLGLDYEVLTSEDLIHWPLVGGQVPAITPITTICDGSTAVIQKKFYQVRLKTGM